MTDYLDLIERALRIIEKSTVKPKTRKSFSKSIKNQVLKNQDRNCMDCGEKLDEIDYDHIDGNSSNNSLENCQALCPNCHAKKTRKTRQKKLKLSQAVRTLKSLLKKLK